MKKQCCRLLLPIAVLLVTCTWYWVLFHADNKYTAAVRGGYGSAVCQENPDNPSFLIDGWEYYPGQLLGPKDFTSGCQEPIYTFIGEYSNFSAQLDSPYGTATYRLTLINEGDPKELVLYLPELLSAGKVYLNGTLVGEQGEISPYDPLVVDRLYPFTIEDSVEIIIQCANFSHYYSGMYYPPAIGSMEGISRMLILRLVFYGLLCFSALTLALVYLVQRALGGGIQIQWMGLLSLAYALWVCYPFLRALGIPSVRLLYGLEDLCSNLVLLCAILLAGELSGAALRRYHRTVAVPLAAGMCIFTLIFPLFILPYAPDFINLYGIVLFFWKLAAALYLLALSLHSYEGESFLGRYLLCAGEFFALSLAVSMLFSNRLEPIYGPWPQEYGGFALVIGFAATLIHKNLLLARENYRLTLHLREEVDRKTQGIEQLLHERRELLARVLHDLKNPLAALSSYAQLVQQGGVALDAETEQYLEALVSRACDVRERLDQLQSFSRKERGLSDLSPLCLNSFLEDFHKTNRPDIELSGVEFSLHLPNCQLFVLADKERLQIALENLCYNALSFTPADGKIALGLTHKKDFATIFVQDTGCGIAEEDLPHIFARGFTKRPDSDSEGLGLYLVQTIAQEYGGSVRVASSPGKGSTFFFDLPLVPAAES